MEHRRRVLGDHGDSAPEVWDWGGPNTDPIHILLMLYAKDEEQLEQFYLTHAEGFKEAGLVQIRKLEALTLKGRKEHFGFRDGIAQPLIAGLNKPGTAANTVKAGEFLLGHLNEYGQYTESPLIDASEDKEGLLHDDVNGSGKRDFGRNGSYLVFRQLRQHVHRFWQFMDESTKNADSKCLDKIKFILFSAMLRS